MIDIKVYKPIDREDVFLSWFGFEDEIFNTEKIQKIFNENPDEKEFRFQINCDGGSVYEGLRIYDYLRSCEGKIYHTNIEGSCHSMAMILLLAAPAENRTANPNARALIHEVRNFVFDDMTADEMREMADAMDQEQDAILKIYAERTGRDYAELEQLMKEEKIRTATELLNYGFIKSINTYSTNKKKDSKMTKNKETLLNKVDSLLTKFKNLLEGDEPVNYEHKDAEGAVLFTTEKEDDSIAVGDPATPAGTFTLTDGRTVVIAEVEGVMQITEITEAENNANTAALEAENSQLRESLTEATNLINELKNEISSNFKPANRQTSVSKGAPTAVKTVEEMKNEMLARRAKKGGKA